MSIGSGNPRMSAGRIGGIAAAFPWLPADYLRHLTRITPGPHAYRYGAQWLDGPQVAEAAFGAQVGRLFPEARLIARRHGNLIGYTGWAAGHPRLMEWGRSQERVVQEFDGIAEALRGQGLEPTGLGPDAFGRFIREDLVRWKTLTQELGIRAEN